MPEIHRLSTGFVVTGELRHRTAASIAAAIGDFGLVRLDRALVGCVAIGRPPGADARPVLYNFCVHPDHQGRGVGRLLLDRAVADARAAGATHLFTASRSAGSWFRRAGFVPVDRDAAPDAWAGSLDPARGSTVYMLPLRNR